LRKGEKYTIHPGEVHSEYNPTNHTVKFTVKITPGHEGYENMMRILYGLASDEKVNQEGLPNDFSTLALLMQMGDTYFTSYFTCFKPWLEWNARKARKNGTEAELYKFYCRPW
jgi:hypothetical protein